MHFVSIIFLRNDRTIELTDNSPMSDIKFGLSFDFLHRLLGTIVEPFASFIDWSYLTVTTIGETKYLSQKSVLNRFLIGLI